MPAADQGEAPSRTTGWSADASRQTRRRARPAPAAAWPHERAPPAADVALRLRYADLRLQKGFDELLSLGAISNVEHFGYQLDTVRRVLRDFRGRVLLADEGGLGKTLEARLAWRG